MGRAPAEVASAIVGVTIFGVAGLLVGLLAVGAVLEDGAPLLLVLVPVMLAFGVGVWANARAIVRKRA